MHPQQLAVLEIRGQQGRHQETHFAATGIADLGHFLPLPQHGARVGLHRSDLPAAGAPDQQPSPGIRLTDRRCLGRRRPGTAGSSHTGNAPAFQFLRREGPLAGHWYCQAVLIGERLGRCLSCPSLRLHHRSFRASHLSDHLTGANGHPGSHQQPHQPSRHGHGSARAGPNGRFDKA